MAIADTTFRAAGPSTPADLGLLHKLPGRWIGKGFNLIARPAKQGKPDKPSFLLELNATHETLEFTAIGGGIPNRGEIEPTAWLHAVTYVQTVTDCERDSGIHKEPGLWVRDPTEVLRAAVKDQTNTETDVIEISTTRVGGILNIPFVVKNANAVQMDAIFWIETVKHPSEKLFFQLQYVQRVILDFDDIHWPHISVATLVKE